jgi:UDP-2,3-diacylglucosamine hydrolase
MRLERKGDGPLIVVSDLHLGAVPTSTERAFRRFLDHHAAESSVLLINGDLWEYGMGYRSAIPRQHVRVIAKLADLVEGGLPIYFLGGNHDYVEWSGEVLQKEAGVRLLPDPVRVQFGEQRILISHGDEVADGRGSLARRIGRARFVVSLLRGLHPDWVAPLQPRTTSTRKQVERVASLGDSGPKRGVAELEAWARKAIAADPEISLVLAGHTHLPAMIEIAPGSHYVNSGDWIFHFTYVSVPAAGPPQLLVWPREQS